MKTVLAFLATMVLGGCVYAQQVPDVIAPDCSSVTITDPTGAKAMLTKQFIAQQLTQAQQILSRDQAKVVQDDYTILLYTPPQMELAACKVATPTPTTTPTPTPTPQA